MSARVKVGDELSSQSSKDAIFVVLHKKPRKTLTIYINLPFTFATILVKILTKV